MMLRPPPVTIKDVARVAGVGIATVSRVVHNHPSVASDLRRRVEAAMRELGYQPSAAAQTMRTRTTRTIACAIRDISIPEFATFVQAAEAVARQAGYILLLTNTDEDLARELELAQILGRRRVDGLLMTRSEDRDPIMEEALARLRIPVVYIDRDPSPIADAVLIDHGHGIRAAVDHLVSLGHERIALVTGRPTMRPARERIAAFEAALACRGIRAAPVEARSFIANQAFQDVSLLLGVEPRPTAVIAGGMALLPAVLRAVSLRGVAVGRDISIVAGCDSDLAELSTPSVTAIRWNVRACGRTCAQLLIDRLADGPGTDESAGGRQIILPTELIIRRSTNPPPPARAPADDGA